MIISRKHIFFIVFAIVCIFVLSIVHVGMNAGDLSPDDFWNAFFHYNDSVIEQSIVREVRFPRMIMALIAGGGLSVAGLLMQTLFKNPLAGPYVLGINSGASLFVAFSIMTGIPFLTSDIGTISNALLGAFIFGMIIAGFAGITRTQISLLLIGIMLGSFTSAFVSLLQTISDAEELKIYTLWALGSLQRAEFNQLPLISLVFAGGIVSSFFLIKPLNIMVMGQEQAELMGVNMRVIRYALIGITALLTGLITAFCGPIAFVGLAVPNLVRIMLKTQHHRILILACLVLGALFVLLCDMVIISLEDIVHIPINVFTSVIGAPIVILLVLKRLK